MTAQLHVTAVLGLLTGAGVTCHDGAVPANPSYPYAVLYINEGDHDETDLTSASRQQTYDVQITAVGATAASARICATKARVALVDVIPTVAGRTCWPVREDRDITLTGTATHPFYAVDTYRVASLPST
jgi:hypothetical protein